MNGFVCFFFCFKAHDIAQQVDGAHEQLLVAELVDVQQRRQVLDRHRQQPQAVDLAAQQVVDVRQ